MLRNNNAPNKLGEAPVIQLLLQYSLPAIIAMTATSLYNIIDSIFIGRGVGADAIAGLAITFPLMNLVFAFCFLIAAGGTTLSSIFLGQKDENKAIETLHSVSLLSVVHGILFGSITLLFLEPILSFFGATETTMPYAYDFMQTILLITPITFIYFSLINLMRAVGHPKKAMISTLLSVLINIILAPIFIFVFQWGIKGAAWATNISQIISVIWILSHFVNKNHLIRYRKGYKWFDSKLAMKMYGIGLSPFIINVCSCLVVIIINKLLIKYGGEYGDYNVGAYGIVNRVAMLSIMIMLGISQGMQPILGYNFGAAEWDRVKQTLRYSIYIAAIVSVSGWLICEIIPNTITLMFTDDIILIALAERGFFLYFLFWPLVGPQIIIQNFFQSIGMPKVSIILSTFRQIIIIIPLLFILSHYFGTDGVWIGLSGSDLLASVLSIIVLVVEIRKLNRLFDEKKLSLK